MRHLGLIRNTSHDDTMFDNGGAKRLEVYSPITICVNLYAPDPQQMADLSRIATSKTDPHLGFAANTFFQNIGSKRRTKDTICKTEALATGKGRQTPHA